MVSSILVLSPIETPGQGINDLSFNAYAGQTITFDQSHSSNGDGGGNTIALSESPDGTHNSGADFTTNVEL